MSSSPHLQTSPIVRGPLEIMTTTFMRVSDSETPVIEVDSEKKLSRIDPMIYGGFTE